MASPADNRRGIVAMLVGTTSFVANDACVRLAAETLPTGQIMALRGVAATALIAAFAWSNGAWRDWRRAASPLVAARGLLECMIAALYIAILPLLPLADLTAVLLASSLAATGLAAGLGLEKVGVRRWLALCVGFAGVLVVLRPGAASLTIPAALAFVCTVLVALRDLATSRAPAGTPTTLIALSTTALVAATGFLIGVAEPAWRAPTGTEIAYLLASAVLVSAGGFLIVMAFRTADIAVAAAFRYSSLVSAMLLGYLIWREAPDRWSLIGSAMIVASGVYTIWREQVRNREARQAGMAS